MNVDSLLERFALWVSTQPDVQGAALVGSHARDAATEKSDVDLMILTTEVEKYFQSDEWVSSFGKVLESRAEDWGRVKALRAFYRDGVEAEYNFALPDWADIPVDAGTRRVVSDGMKILYDPRGLLKILQEEVAATE